LVRVHLRADSGLDGASTLSRDIVRLQVQELVDVQAYGMTLTWDPAVLSFVDAQPAQTAGGDGLFRVFQQRPDRVLLGNARLADATLEDGLLAELTFRLRDWRLATGQRRSYRPPPGAAGIDDGRGTHRAARESGNAAALRVRSRSGLSQPVQPIDADRFFSRRRDLDSACRLRCPGAFRTNTGVRPDDPVRLLFGWLGRAGHSRTSCGQWHLFLSPHDIPLHRYRPHDDAQVGPYHVRCSRPRLRHGAVTGR